MTAIDNDRAAIVKELITDTVVPLAQAQERRRVVEQFTAALLTGLDDLERDDRRRIGPGDVADLVHRVAAEVRG